VKSEHVVVSVSLLDWKLDDDLVAVWQETIYVWVN
jgi:hypothetical protein